MNYTKKEDQEFALKLLLSAIKKIANVAQRVEDMDIKQLKQIIKLLE